MKTALLIIGMIVAAALLDLLRKYVEYAGYGEEASDWIGQHLRRLFSKKQTKNSKK